MRVGNIVTSNKKKNKAFYPTTPSTAIWVIDSSNKKLLN